MFQIFEHKFIKCLIRKVGKLDQIVNSNGKVDKFGNKMSENARVKLTICFG